MDNNASSLAIDLTGVTKYFGATSALRGVDLSLAWGRTLVLFGHNGAGKSTLLRTLSTLVRPDEGSVRVAGFDREKQAAKVRASIGYVGHQPLLYDEMTPEENLRFYAKMYGVKDAPARIARVLADVGATAWTDRRVRALSNGMQKRVAIARAMLHQPPVLLLDEPETGLDQSGLELLDMIVTSVRDSGASVVMTTHNVERGLALADRAAVLTEGRVVLAADAKELTVGGVQDLVAGTGKVA